MDDSTAPDRVTPPDGIDAYEMPLPRLKLTPEAGHGPLDGAWWPRCDALELELPALVGMLNPDAGAVTGVTVDAASWPDAPGTVMAPHQVIAVAETLLATEEHAITVDCGSLGRWELLVIPPDEPPGTATRLLRAAADPENPLSAPRLLALTENGVDGEAAWESEGGPAPVGT